MPEHAPTHTPSILSSALEALGLPADAGHRLTETGNESLPSCLPVSDLATASIGAAALAASELVGLDGPAPTVTVDRHLSSAWFVNSLEPRGWEPAPQWDAIAGDYRTLDGWIRLHTNAPHHRAAALAVLGCGAERGAVARAVAGFAAKDLETAIVEAGGCAAEMRDADAWRAHPQGQAVGSEPLVALAEHDAPLSPWRPDPARPLAGVRVLDLTRLLAGPVATRFLAGLGADVLRIDPPGWEEPALDAEVTLGKRCARLDLKRAEDRPTFEALLASADILVHGYRNGALDGLGYGAARRREIRPGLVDISLCAYGWSGPWTGRRGFDSLVQMSSGIAAAGMAWTSSEKLFLLPVQALDHATGYLLAAAAIRGLVGRLRDGRAVTARLSLARTARALIDAPWNQPRRDFGGLHNDDYNPQIEQTDWGPARRLRPPVLIAGAPLQWDRPATRFGSLVASWK